MGSVPKTTKHLLVDLDGTLYRSAKLFDDVRKNINAYIIDALGVKAEEANDVSGRLYREYGLTVVGLMSEDFGVELDDWHKAVHGTLDYKALLPPNPELRDLLQSLPMPKDIFTNADRIHAGVCLDHIGIKDCFEDIISFDCIVDQARAMAPPGASKKDLMAGVFCKPDLRSFEYALKRVGAEAATTMFLDDSVANIKAAKAAGLQTVLVGRKDLCEGADFAIENFLQLREAAPHLWHSEE